MEATTRKTTFADHFTVADAQALLGYGQKEDGRGGGLILAHMATALSLFMPALRTEGRLHPIPGCGGHELHFADAWNRIAAGGTDPGDFLAVSEEIGVRIAMEGIVLRDGNITPSAEAAHAAICDYADRGRFSASAGSSAITDQSVYIRFEDWTGVGTAHKKGHSEPLRDAQPIGHQSGEITFPTGRLLVSDWFRCRGFNEAIGDHEGASLNSDRGRVQSTLHKLSRGLASFHLGNTCPGIYLRDGALLIGENRAMAEHDWDSDAEEPEEREIDGHKGQVCTDLWAASIIDQKTLMDLLEQELGSAEAAFDAYAEYRKSTYDQITEIQVEPGTYEVHFGPNHEEFARTFRHDAVPALAEIAAYGAIVPKTGK